MMSVDKESFSLSTLKHLDFWSILSRMRALDNEKSSYQL